MGKKVALVACVGKKNPEPMAAQDLYISAWFLKASAYAAREADEWYILSAKYGLISPSTVIEPYDETLNRMPAAERRAWAGRVWEELARRLSPNDEVLVLAGQAYRAGLVGPMQEMGCTVLIPMEGKRIGQQLAWLNELLEE